MHLVVCWCAFVVALFCTATASGAQSPADVVQLRERALVLLNAFEAWSFVYTPPEVDSARFICEPREGGLRHACYPGTIPPCLLCERYIAFPTFSDEVEDRASFLAAERRMMATIDSAALADPSDELIVSMRVFLLTKRGLFDEALRSASPQQCAFSIERCTLLRGFVHQASHNTRLAGASFDSAFSRINATDRCAIMSSWAVHDERDRTSYARLPCPAREAVDEVFWWLADPSYLVPGNDRLTEHIARGVGNQILAAYRAVRTSIGGVMWWASVIPKVDSVERFFTYPQWVRHPAGPWRWYDELTRFGPVDAVSVKPGLRSGFNNVKHVYNGVTNYGTHSDGCDNLKGQTCVPVTRGMCEMGFEPRDLSFDRRAEMSPPNSARNVPERRHPHEAFYPDFVFYGYRWAETNSYGCTRLYNSHAKFQFTPVWRNVADPFSMQTGDWELGEEAALTGGPPHREQYSPPYGPATLIDEFQLSRLPRGDSMLVLAVLRDDGHALNVGRARVSGRKFETALIATSTVPPRTGEPAIARVRTDSFVKRLSLTAMMPTQSIFTGLEILTPDTIGYSRRRTGLPLSPWLDGKSKLSDIVFFQADTVNLPEISVLDSLLSRAHTSNRISRGAQLGLYWEMQVADLGESVIQTEVELRIERTDGPHTFVGRLVAGLFGDRNLSRGIRWTLPAAPMMQGNFSRWSNSVVISTANLRPGDYTFSLAVKGSPAISQVTRRSLTIVR